MLIVARYHLKRAIITLNYLASFDVVPPDTVTVRSHAS